MSARVEAAAKAMRDKYAAEVCELPVVSFTGDAQSAIAATDAVMFDDAAVERAARLLWIADQDADIGFWGNLLDTTREYYRHQVRAVIAALKGDDA